MKIYLLKGYHGLSQAIKYIEDSQNNLIIIPYDLELAKNYEKIFKNLKIKKFPEIKFYGPINLSFLANFKNFIFYIYCLFYFMFFFIYYKQKISNIFHFYPINSFGYDIICKLGTFNKINIQYVNIISKNIKFLNNKKTFKNKIINFVFRNKYEKVLVNGYHTWFNLHFKKFKTYEIPLWPHNIVNIWNKNISKENSLLILDTLIDLDSKIFESDIRLKINNFIESQQKFNKIYLKPHYRKEKSNYKNLFYDALRNNYDIEIIPSWIPSEIILNKFNTCISLYSSSWHHNCIIFWLTFIIDTKYKDAYNLLINETDSTLKEINEYYKIKNFSHSKKNVIISNGPFCIL